MLLEITDLTQKGLEVGASYVFGDIDDEKEFKKLKGDLNNITKKGNEVYISSDDYKLDEVGAKLNIKFGSKIITLDLNVVG